VVGEDITTVAAARAGVIGMAIISKERMTAAARTLKNLLRFICYLRHIAEHGDYYI
jgi:hypothetical protein